MVTDPYYEARAAYGEVAEAPDWVFWIRAGQACSSPPWAFFADDEPQPPRELWAQYLAMVGLADRRIEAINRQREVEALQHAMQPRT
jgi:hypothetical protein